MTAVTGHTTTTSQIVGSTAKKQKLDKENLGNNVQVVASRIMPISGSLNSTISYKTTSTEISPQEGEESESEIDDMDTLPNPEKRANSTPEIYNKRSTVQLGDRSYQIEQIAKGSFHTISEFIDPGFITVDEKIISLANCVFRGCRMNLEVRDKPAFLEMVLTQDTLGYSYLQSNHVPLPEVYLKGLGADKSGWLIQKMNSPVYYQNWANNKTLEELSTEDKKALKFAKDWFKNMVEKNSELIPDFKPNNVMFDRDGNLRVTDFGEGQQVVAANFARNFSLSLTRWSQENPHILEYLTKGIDLSRLALN